MRRKSLGFVFLVCFFTIFGGGRSQYWTVVCQDDSGVVYEVDRRTMNLIDGHTFHLRVKVSRGERSRIDRWMVDTSDNTLTVEGEEPQFIEQNSPASQVLHLLKHRGKLPDSQDVL